MPCRGYVTYRKHMNLGHDNIHRAIYHDRKRTGYEVEQPDMPFLGIALRQKGALRRSCQKCILVSGISSHVPPDFGSFWEGPKS